MSETTPPSGGVFLARKERGAVWALAVAQTLGYACFFYIFAALVLDWHRSLPWGDGVIAGGPLVAIVVTALLSPKVGRWVDRGLALRVMAIGIAAGALGLVVLAVAGHPAVFLAAFALLGVAAAMSLYEVSFALLIRRFGDKARAEITKVTLVAGLASTLAFPAGAWLSVALGWRGAVWVALAVILCAMLPLQLWAAWVLGGGRKRGTIPDHAPTSWRVLLAKPGTVGLMALFALISLDHWMIVNLLRPILDRIGLANGVAVLAASLIGPAQVAGRMALMAAGDRLASGRAMVLTAVTLIGASLLLLAAPLGAWAVFGFALLQGAAMGVLTILRPVLVSSIHGARDYASAAAAISLPGMLATALAPMVGTGLMALGGVGLLLTVSLGLCALALILALRQRG
ncbi:MFS transporter [Thioclava sp. FR2]|uniref:MFS transporter n=1 Tax=Thioclava sp. FR2 TaxID=3445780 RepID=UPI003EBCAA8C